MTVADDAVVHEYVGLDQNRRRLRFEPANLDYVREALTGTVRGSGTAIASPNG